jgi:hypothetical protein
MDAQFSRRHKIEQQIPPPPGKGGGFGMTMLELVIRQKLFSCPELLSEIGVRGCERKF